MFSLIGRDKNVLLASLLALGAALAGYWSLQSGLPGSFLVDDLVRITNTKILNLSPDMLSLAITSADSGAVGRPVSLLSLYLTKYLQGNDPAAFKHENILLHILTGLVLYWLTYRLMHVVRVQHGYPGNRSCAILAALVAAVWILHPLHVSTVLYVVQRMTILSALFTASALLMYVIARMRGFSTVSGLAILALLFPAFSLLGLLSKEDAALIPVYLLLIEAFIFRFSSRNRIEQRILLVVCGLIIALPLVAGGLYFVFNMENLLHDYAVRDFTLSERLGSEAVIVWRYVGMLVIPRLNAMSLYHDTAPIYSLTDLTPVLAILCWIAACAGAWLVRRKYPLVSCGIFLFLAGHILESTIFPLELMFEHRNYFPSWGLLTASIMAVSHALRAVEFPTWVPRVAAIVFLSLLLFLQHTRATTWSDKHALIATTLLDHPSSVRAASALANIYMNHGEYQKANETLDNALEHSEDRYSLGIRLHQLGLKCYGATRFPEPLFRDIADRIDSAPLTAYALSGLQVLSELVRTDRCPPVTIPQVHQLVTRATDNSNTRRQYRFRTRTMSAELNTYRGRFQQAARDYEDARRFFDSVPSPVRVRTLISLADIYIELDRPSRAMDTIDEAKRMLETGGRPVAGAQQLIEKQLRILGKGAP